MERPQAYCMMLYRSEHGRAMKERCVAVDNVRHIDMDKLKEV